MRWTFSIWPSGSSIRFSVVGTGQASSVDFSEGLLYLVAVTWICQATVREGLERAPGGKMLTLPVPSRITFSCGAPLKPTAPVSPSAAATLTAPILHPGKPLTALRSCQAPLLLPVPALSGSLALPTPLELIPRVHSCVQLGSRDNTSKVPLLPRFTFTVPEHSKEDKIFGNLWFPCHIQESFV